MSLMEVSQLLGNFGEFVGAIAVVVTLIYLAMQVRHSSVLLETNNAALKQTTELAKAEAMDRYNDAVSRWRGRLIENPEIVGMWGDVTKSRLARRLSETHGWNPIDATRFENMYTDWLNTYRGNFRRATLMGDDGLSRQAVMSVATVLNRSSLFRDLWMQGHGFLTMGSQDFVEAVEAELNQPI